MNTSRLNDLVGSWIFIRSTDPNFNFRQIYHFTSDGFNYWEVDQPEGSERHLAKLEYKFSDGNLTLIYDSGTQKHFSLSEESDGAIKFPGMNGHTWWMTRLEKPASYSRAFVGSSGRLHELNDTEQDAAANP